MVKYTPNGADSVLPAFEPSPTFFSITNHNNPIFAPDKTGQAVLAAIFPDQDLHKPFTISTMNLTIPIAQQALFHFPHGYFSFYLNQTNNTHNFFGCALIVPLKKDG